VTRLSVNLNKIALLRNARGGCEPDLLRAARTCLAAGAHGITLHPRPDARHARTDDVRLLARLAQAEGAEFNLEGNPFAAPRADYPGFLALCAEARPTQATLVPDADAQLTSDHGFDFVRDAARLQPVIAALKSLGCRVSLFADAGSAVAMAAGIGADRIEIYTGPFAEAHATGDARDALRACADTAAQAQHTGLGVNAGHDLNQHNLAAFLAEVPGVLEVSIGHALVAESLYEGLDATVRRYLAIVDAAA
jgi:pyridoxine 5-phosphate synthase